MEFDIERLAIIGFAVVLILLQIYRLEMDLRSDDAEYVSDDEDDEAWSATYQHLPLKFYGEGAHYNFDYYFTRSSSVEVKSIGDVVRWLLGCEYVIDSDYRDATGEWQHPVDFEVTRRGDCVDFSLWAWRKLVELGLDAEFMVGKWMYGDGVETHTWVYLHCDDGPYVLETAGRSKAKILKAHTTAEKSYVPFASVDAELRRKIYGGVLKWAMDN